MTYTLLILPSAQKDCDRLDKTVYKRVRKAIFHLEKEARPSGCKKLIGNDGYRIRVGDYRILYRIEDKSRRIFIYRVKHRGEAYR